MAAAGDSKFTIPSGARVLTNVGPFENVKCEMYPKDTAWVLGQLADVGSRCYLKFDLSGDAKQRREMGKLAAELTRQLSAAQNTLKGTLYLLFDCFDTTKAIFHTTDAFSSESWLKFSAYAINLYDNSAFGAMDDSPGVFQLMRMSSKWTDSNIHTTRSAEKAAQCISEEDRQFRRACWEWSLEPEEEFLY